MGLGKLFSRAKEFWKKHSDTISSVSNKALKGGISILSTINPAAGNVASTVAKGVNKVAKKLGWNNVASITNLKDSTNESKPEVKTSSEVSYLDPYAKQNYKPKSSRFL